MSKNNKAIQKMEESEEEIDFDFGMCQEDHDENTFEMAEIVMESANFQMMRAMELTKIVVDKNSSPMNEDEIFSIFKKAFRVVDEVNPIKAILNNLTEEE